MAVPAATVPTPMFLHLSMDPHPPQYHTICCMHNIFVCRNYSPTPLQLPYGGPFKVIQPDHKTFQIDRGGWRDTVSVDQLKLVHVTLEEPDRAAEPKPQEQPYKQ